jgi:hypothetical protein
MLYRIFLTVAVILTPSFFKLSAGVGCLDNSWRLLRRYDSKEYHVVSCNCPCDKYEQLEDRGRCIKCRHFHDAIPLYTVSRTDLEQDQSLKEKIEKQVSKKMLQLRKTDNPFAHLFHTYLYITQ